MMRPRLEFALLIALFPAVLAAQSPEPVTLPELERLALENQPTLAQAAAAVDAARGRARQAGAFPNPIVGYSGDELLAEPEAPRGTHGVFIEQMIPLGGKRGLARAVGEREVAVAEARAAAQRQRILNGVRSAFYGTLAATRRVDVRERLAQLAAEAVMVTRQLYNVGAADRPDILEAEIEAHRARLDAEDARNRRFRAWRQLAAVVGIPDLPERPLAGEFDSALPELEREQIRATLLEQSPEVRAGRAGIERGEVALRRARRQPFPDFFLNGGPGYNRERQDGRPDRPVGWEWSIEAGVSVPLFNRNRGGVTAAAAELSQARSEVARLQLDLERRLAASWEEYLSALRSAEVYTQEILPRAEEAYQLYLAKYRQMAAAYPQVLIAQRTLFQVAEAQVAAVERAWRAAVGLQGFLLEDGTGTVGTRGAEQETEVRHE